MANDQSSRVSSMADPTIGELFDLSGRVALVTGGAGFLGRSFCAALAETGASVVVASRDQQRAEDAAAQLSRIGDASHYGITLDHKNETSLQRGFDAVLEKAGRIDVLVNNGQSGPAEDWTDATPDGFQAYLDNVTGYFMLSRRVRDHAVDQGTPASIVMIGSMYGVVGSYPDAYEGVCPASPAAYHAAKGGVIHLTRHLAVYWAKDGVRVNCLSPGPFPNLAAAPAAMIPRLEAKSPMGRMGRPHELKGALLLLASDAGSYITGQNLLVDGGWTAW
jgi:NAD(P)-dependent dehydrogenase (short-subunit alcohol dehydrogenase family)